MVKSENTYISSYNYIAEVKEYCDILILDKSQHSISAYLSSIDRFFDFLKIKIFDDILKISPLNCREYQTFLKTNGLQSSSINHHIRNLKVFFNWLRENDKIESNPFEKVKNVKQPKKELSFLSEEEIELIFGGCKNLEEKTILAILLSLGLRRSELVNLKLSDIDGYTVKVIGKGNKYRALYLPDDVYKLLTEWVFQRKYVLKRKYNDLEYVFPSKMGGKYTPEAIRQKVKTIAKRAGIDENRVKEITPHTMRRTFATNMVESDVNMRIIQGALGHASLNTTLRYAKLRDSAVENAMRNQRSIIK